MFLRPDRQKFQTELVGLVFDSIHDDRRSIREDVDRGLLLQSPRPPIYHRNGIVEPCQTESACLSVEASAGLQSGRLCRQLKRKTDSNSTFRRWSPNFGGVELVWGNLEQVPLKVRWNPLTKD
ncbi:unnamed protein product, partial [Protopolystoma xenopodis]